MTAVTTPVRTDPTADERHLSELDLPVEPDPVSRADDELAPVARRRSRYWKPVRIAAVVVAGFFLIGNLSILAAHLWLQRSQPATGRAIDGVNNFTEVDDRVWRGAAPSREGLRDLAAAGVTTIVDLRAEDDLTVDAALLAELGLERHHLPVRDGQAPSVDLVHRFLEVVDASDGTVFVHCGAGVGRTGTMAAAYLVARGGVDNADVVRHNLSVGPPSLEQIVFAARVAKGDIQKPSIAVTAVSRLLDGPRRMWVHVRGSYTKH